MSGRRFALVPYPWRAAIEITSPGPTAFFSSLCAQTFNYRLPARRRWGAIPSFIGRHGLPQGLVPRALRLARKHTRPDIDSLLEELGDAWDELRTRNEDLPQEGRLSTLALERSAGLTLFVFIGDLSQPSIVAKVPRSNQSVDAEMEILTRVAPLGLAPRPLGRVGEMRVQEAIVGSPLRVEPVTPADAGSLKWRATHEGIAIALEHLSSHTSQNRSPRGLEEVATAMRRAELSKRCEEIAVTSVTKVENSRVSVLRHGDVAPQNCLLDRDRFAAFVDWEFAFDAGVPGFDQLNAAISYLELGIGLVRWREDKVIASFGAAWDRSEHFQQARSAALACVRGAGGDTDLYRDVEVAFFARRLQRSLAGSRGPQTEPRVSAAMLELVCSSGNLAR